MKNLKKFLRSSWKLEARHTNRKAREVEEVYRFNLQQAYHQHSELDRLLEFESTHAQHVTQDLAPLLDAEQERLVQKSKDLMETEELEDQVQEVRPDSSDRAIEQIADLQGVPLHPQPHRPKQLPASSHDAFAHELSDLTEIHLHQETARNERALKQGTSSDIEYWDDSDEYSEDGANSVLYLRPGKPKNN